MTYQGHDIYCDLILSGKLEVERVFETESVLAFHHTRPFWPVHIVVIPKRHIPSVLEAEDGAMLELLAVVRRVAAQVVPEQGACRILTNLGAYQDSKHLHWHVSAGEPLRDSRVRRG
jgi:histidine triad (HIT) family protein